MPGTGWPRVWPRVPSWLRSELLHEWIRSGGILIAAAWGVYTFVWKDILVPAWQPAHLSLEASLAPVPGRPPTPAGVEMTLEIKGSNASSRRVYLLANVWWLSSLQRDPLQNGAARRETDFLRDADQALRDVSLRHSERGVVSQPGHLLAIGRLFDDDFIDPGASLTRTILVRLPQGTTAAELQVTLPLLTRRPDGLFHRRRLAWGLTDTRDLMPLLCAEASRAANHSTLDCLPAGADLDQALERIDSALHRFDPQHSTITLTKQIGLPRPSAATP